MTFFDSPFSNGGIFRCQSAVTLAAQSREMVLSFAWYQNVGYPFSFDISLTACWEIEFAHFAGNSTEGSRHFLLAIF
jgi:hypothetical protein